MSDVSKEEIIHSLQVLLDCVDYTEGACSVNEMVGAVLPKEVILMCRDIIKRNNK